MSPAAGSGKIRAAAGKRMAQRANELGHINSYTAGWSGRKAEQLLSTGDPLRIPVEDQTGSFLERAGAFLGLGSIF
jgi:hypothetical protein